MRDKSRAARFRHNLQHRIRGIQRLLGEIQPGNKLLEKPAHENGNLEVRGLRLAIRAVGRAWLDRSEGKPAVVICRNSPEAEKWGGTV